VSVIPFKIHPLQILKFTGSIILTFLFTLPVLAQRQDTIPENDYKPTGIRFGTDVFSLIRSPLDDSFQGWEVSADIDFYRFFLTAEAGHWGRTFTSPDEDYSNTGTYFRAGVDVNFLKKDPEKNMFFLGARYATSVFDETLTTQLNDTWNRGASTFTNTATKATWGEVTFGLRVKVWKPIWLGYTARFKFALNTNEEGNLVPHDVPGYGSTYKTTTWGFNYYLLYRIPFRK
jgi:hypothetical protein